MRLLILLLLFLTGCGLTGNKFPHYDIPTNPQIIKSNVVLHNEFESQPFVWNGQLKYILNWRFSAGAGNNAPGASIRIYDFNTKALEHEFGQNLILSTILVDNGTAYVYSVNKWASANTSIVLSTSTDLVNWTNQTVYSGDKIFNTSVSKTPTGYVMAYETFNGNNLSTQFLVSTDLINWTHAGSILEDNQDASCPTIRFINGKYYVWYLVRYNFQPYYITKIARSSDLVTWEISPKVFLAPTISELTNNSDMDLVEFNGQVYIFYNSGDQNSQFWITYATYSGTLQNLVDYYF